MSEPTKDVLRSAMKRAFALGQHYWQQVDSEYASHWKKGEVTKATFDALTDETCAAVTGLIEAGQRTEAAIMAWRHSGKPDLYKLHAAHSDLIVALARVGGAK